jgi:hypothetical protein
MKRSLFALVLAVAGCGQAADPTGPVVVSEQELVEAREVPRHAPAELRVSGVAEPLHGAFQLVVGPDGEEQYTLAAYSDDARVALMGTIELGSPELAPRPLEQGGISSRWHAEGDYAWLAENRGSFSVVENGEEAWFAMRAITIRVEPTGLFAAELRGVATSRIDAKNKRIQPGEDKVITVRGRLVGSCLTRTATGAVIMDPTNQTPRCQELFSQL